MFVQRIVTTEDRHDGVKYYVLYNSFLRKNVKLKTEIYVYLAIMDLTLIIFENALILTEKSAKNFFYILQLKMET